MNEYTLYLDESKNKKNTRFVVAGIIVKSSDVHILESNILDVKKCIWDDDYISKQHPILHCVEITNIKNNRGNIDGLNKLLDKYRYYKNLKGKEKEEIKAIYDNVIGKMSKTIKVSNGIVLGCLIDIEKTKFIYGDVIDKNEDLFFDIALQEIIENYAHFLINNNATGNIIYESRNSADSLSNNSSDAKMFSNFCKIKLCNKGITFIKEEIISKTIKFFEIRSKKEDISGLQLADFICYSLVHNYNVDTPKNNSEFTNKVLARLYNGMYDIEDRDLRYFFGLKLLPFDYKQIDELKKENLRIKKSHDNIKDEKNNLLEKIEKLEEKKEKLLKEIEDLKLQLTK